jgi:hypothetical protein
MNQRMLAQSATRQGEAMYQSHWGTAFTLCVGDVLEPGGQSSTPT